MSIKLVQVPTKQYTIEYPYGLDGSDLVAAGSSAMVVRLDAVLKFGSNFTDPSFLETEKRIYQRLRHDNNGVVRYYGSLEDALILQYASNGSIRQYLKRQTEPIPLSLRLRWVEQITTSVAFVHSRHVLHGDISCNNVFLDETLNTKHGDFAGSSIIPLIYYETSHGHPELEEISIKSEVFALGSTFYEIMTGFKPYNELSDIEICDAYRQGNYPSLVSLASFDTVIAKCWSQGYGSVDEVLEDVKAEGIVL